MDRPNLLRALAAGCVATVVMTVALYLSPLSDGKAGFFPMVGTAMGMTDPESARFAWWWGLIWHFNIGAILFPNLYVLAGYPILPGKPIVKGLLWGGLLWMMAIVFGLPLMGYGFLASKTANPFLVCTALLGLHTLYGAVFGAITGEASKEEGVRFTEVREAA